MSRLMLTTLTLGLLFVGTVGMVGCKSDEKVSAVPPAKTADPIAVAPDAGGLYTPPTTATTPIATGGAGSNTGAVVPTHTIGGQGPVVIPSGPAGGAYTVQRGDTLWSIASRHYGSGKRWRDIVNANPGLVPERMAVGQSLRMP